MASMTSLLVLSLLLIGVIASHHLDKSRWHSLNIKDRRPQVGGQNQISETTTTNNKDALGNSFFLPKIDLYSNRVGGTPIFDEIDPKCLLSYPEQRQTRQNLYFYEDTQSFYNKIATMSNLKITGKYTMGTTLNAKTSSISRGSIDVRGNTLRMWTHTKTNVLDDGCYRLPGGIPISATVIKALNDLPLTIGKPEYKISWQPYEHFLEKYGSHVVTKIHMGSSIRSSTFSKKTTNYSQRQFQVSACVNFESSTRVGKLGVDACTDVTKDEIHKASDYETSTNVNVQGGTKALRDKLVTKRSKELLEQLMNEGRANPAPVDYEYVAVWDIIKMKHPRSDQKSKEMRAKAENLQQYYEGFQDFGCSLQIINKLKMRYFREIPGESSKLAPAYECWMEGEGCRSDQDCHVGDRKKVAYCFGNTCMVHKDPGFGNKAKYAVAQTSKTGDGKDGVNLSCDYNTWQGKAKCHLNYFQSNRIWPQ